MVPFLCGAAGALAVIALLLAGFVLGRCAPPPQPGGPQIPAAPDPAELAVQRSLEAEQRAFRQMLAYDTDAAYGLRAVGGLAEEDVHEPA